MRELWALNFLISPALDIEEREREMVEGGERGRKIEGEIWEGMIHREKGKERPGEVRRWEIVMGLKEGD
jgi:hypothetical protein